MLPKLLPSAGLTPWQQEKVIINTPWGKSCTWPIRIKERFSHRKQQSSAKEGRVPAGKSKRDQDGNISLSSEA
ncbi:hypothetical protein GOBAR_AA00956 [Gossypium barbadense]|uniref:Uncharacterized protein n=1 Tax=Gossypium barbadense TaxID=3634 RepID=A0A2P5YVH1_GOSBA|nr:hypothetical protein GOBAR_AA00956 [Gossypium barbadense]